MPPIDTLVVEGDAAETIVAVAQDGNADLLVMGTEGLSGVKKLMLGSTARRVLKRTDVPVLAVPARAGRDLVSVGPGGPGFALSRILAAVDFSESSVAAARVGVRLARLLGLPVSVAHVVPAIHTISRWQPFLESHEDTRRAEAERQLHEIVAAMGPDVQAVLVSGSPVGELMRLAGEDHTLVTLGLMSRGHLLGPGPGAVAYRLLAEADAPVLAVTSRSALARKSVRPAVRQDRASALQE